MKRTVFAFARSRAGIIAVRKAGETQWHFLEIEVPADEHDWRKPASRGFEAATGIRSSPQDWELIISKACESGSKNKERETIYGEIRISDPQILPAKRYRGKDGHQVETITYWKAENSYNLCKKERDFLQEHDLLGPF
jgi:hypothetical protein